MSVPRPAPVAVRQLKRIRRPWGELRWPARFPDDAARALLGEIEHVRDAVEALSARSLPPNLTIELTAAAVEPAVRWAGDAVDRVVFPAFVLVSPEGCRSVLAHEFAHATLFAPACPFLSEGWAVASSYAIEAAATKPFPAQSFASLVALRTAGPRHGLRRWLGLSPDDPPFRSPDVFTFERRAAYAHAGSFVRFVLDRFGRETLTAVFEEVRSGTSAAAALEQYCGALDELEAAWDEAAGPSRAPPGEDGRAPVPYPPGAWSVRRDDDPVHPSLAIDTPASREAISFRGELLDGAWRSPVVWGAAPAAPPRAVRFTAAGTARAAAVLVQTASAPQPYREFVEVFRPTRCARVVTVDCGLMFRFFDDGVAFRPHDVTSIGFAVMGPSDGPFELCVSRVEVIP